MWLWYEGFPAMYYPVGMKEPNPWGFQDMHGHVQEWCMDWYGPYPETLVTNPSGPRLGTKRVMRGLNREPLGLKCARSARRYSHYPDDAAGNYGFRVVLELPECRWYE